MTLTKFSEQPYTAQKKMRPDETPRAVCNFVRWRFPYPRVFLCQMLVFFNRWYTYLKKQRSSVHFNHFWWCYFVKLSRVRFERSFAAILIVGCIHPRLCVLMTLINVFSAEIVIKSIDFSIHFFYFVKLFAFKFDCLLLTCELFFYV